MRRAATLGAVAFPENILTEDEQVVMHLHPHWKEMVRPGLVLLLGIAVVTASWLWLPEDDAAQIGLYAIGAVVLGLVAWLSLWPWIHWRTTHYIFTSDRVIYQYGIFRRERRDIPLHRVTNHTMNQTLADRMFRSGTLTIESAATDGSTLLVDVPKVQRVQTLLYELVQADRDKHSLGDDEFREILQSHVDGNNPPAS